MLTHGTGTPGNGNWEINTSFNTDIARESEYTLPLLDFNYGFKEHTQLKFEIPYVFTQPKNKIGNAVMGIKHRFTDEDNHFISFSVYPQIEFSFNGDGDTEYKLLTQFKKTMGRLVVCEELGFIYVPKNSNLFMSGTLIGFKVSDKFESLCELYFLTKTSLMQPPDGLFNFGMRYKLSKKFILLGSLGTQFVMEEKAETKNFFSYIGL